MSDFHYNSITPEQAVALRDAIAKDLGGPAAVDILHGKLSSDEATRMTVEFVEWLNDTHPDLFPEFLKAREERLRKLREQHAEPMPLKDFLAWFSENVRR